MAPLATEAPASYDDLKHPPLGCLLFTKGLTVVLNVISIIIFVTEGTYFDQLANSFEQEVNGFGQDDYGFAQVVGAAVRADITYRRTNVALISISTVTTFAEMIIACLGLSDGECKTWLVIIEKLSAALLTSCLGLGFTYSKSWPTILVFSWASNELGIPFYNALGC
ncbi:hypothetical protein Droror1_Dr00005225 [Drosera rotundifolia]